MRRAVKFKIHKYGSKHIKEVGDTLQEIVTYIYVL